MAWLESLSSRTEPRAVRGAAVASWRRVPERSLLYPVPLLIVSLLIFSPAAAPGQSLVTGQPGPGAETEAEGQAEHRGDDRRFSWKDHPSLRLWDGTQVEFLMRMQGDLRSSDRPFGDESGNDMARRRAGIAGDVAGVVRFEIERELTGDDPWRDVYADYRQFDIVRLQAGKFKLPFSLDENTSATKLDFVYRSMAAESLAPGRDRGVMIHGRVLRRLFKYEIGAFGHDGSNARTSNAQRVHGDLTLAGRVTLRPFHARKSRIADLQIGIAMTGSDLPEGLSGIRGRTVLGERFYRADALVHGRRQRVGFELAWRPGPVSLKSEYMRLTDTRLGQSVENTDLSPLVASGWYVSGTWAVVDRKPRFGALELAARVEALEFNYAAHHSTPSASPRADVVPGSRDTALTLGVNWSPIRCLRIQANVIREVIGAPGRGTSSAPFWSRVVRFQFAI